VARLTLFDLLSRCRGKRRSAIKMLRRARQNAWQLLARNGCKKKKGEEWEKGYWGESLDWEVLGDGGLIE
jgi:hypothetical protein